MSTEEVNTIHQEGPPWKIVGRFPTFELANEKREELLLEDTIQVKVHWQGAVNNRFYAVKVRTDPEIALVEELAQKRAEKKRRKAKLNKKTRKK